MLSQISQEELSYERLRLLLEINNAVVTNLDLHELIHVISITLQDCLPHDFTALAIYDEETKQLRAHAVETAGQRGVIAEGTPLPMEGTFAGVAITKRQTILRKTIDLEEFNAPIFREGAKILHLKSACVVPLILQDRILGAVTLSSCTEAAFSEEDAQLLEQVGSQLAIAVDNAINFRRAKHERDQNQLLLEINNAVTSHLDLKELLAATSACLKRIMPHDVAALALYDHEANVLRVHTLNTLLEHQYADEGFIMTVDNDSPAGKAANTRQPVLTSRLDPAEYPSPVVTRAYDAGFRSSCNVPLISHDRLLGVVAVASRSECAFTQTHAKLFSNIAGQLAIAVENSLTYRELATLKNKLVSEKLYLEEEIQTEYNFEEIIGQSATLKKILQQVATVAPTDSAVLLCGETGTGKELIARAIHNMSARRERTLVKLNCAAIPTGLPTW